MHERSVWRLTSQAEAGFGRFPRPIRLGARTVRWRWEDVREYLAQKAGKQLDVSATPR